MADRNQPNNFLELLKARRDEDLLEMENYGILPPSRSQSVSSNYDDQLTKDNYSGSLTDRNNTQMPREPDSIYHQDFHNRLSSIPLESFEINPDTEAVTITSFSSQPSIETIIITP